MLCRSPPTPKVVGLGSCGGTACTSCVEPRALVIVVKLCIGCCQRLKVWQAQPCAVSLGQLQCQLLLIFGASHSPQRAMLVWGVRVCFGSQIVVLDHTGCSTS